MSNRWATGQKSKLYSIERLETAEECRAFLKRLRIGPDSLPIEWVELTSGKRLSLDEAPDEAVMEFAHDMAHAAELAQRGPTH